MQQKQERILVSDSKCAMCKRLGASSFNLVVYSKEAHGMVKVCPSCYHSIQEDDKRAKDTRLFKEWALTARRI